MSVAHAKGTVASVKAMLDSAIASLERDETSRIVETAALADALYEIRDHATERGAHWAVERAKAALRDYEASL